MRVIEYEDGCVSRFLELEDMPSCRRCGIGPIVKRTGTGAKRLQCHMCGISTPGSTDSQKKFRIWRDVMGDGPRANAWS